MAELYDGSIADAHHYFWDPQTNYYPWPTGDTEISFRYGDYSTVRHRYLSMDYSNDAGAYRVIETVYVETKWGPCDPLGETRFVHHLTERHGVPCAMVAQAWLDAPDAAEVLAVRAGFVWVRSVRYKPDSPQRLQQVGELRSLASDER